jgi:hypothetical protein
MICIYLTVQLTGRSIQAEYQDELLITEFVTGSAEDTFLDYILEARLEGIVSPESKRCSLTSDSNEVTVDKSPARLGNAQLTFVIGAFRVLSCHVFLPTSI